MTAHPARAESDLTKFALSGRSAMITVNRPSPPSQAPGSPVSPGTGRRTAGARGPAAVLGSLCILASAALLGGGGVILAAEQRLSQEGFLTSDRIPLQARGYAV